MALPNDGFARNPDAAGSVNLATQLVSAKEYPVGMEADADGHIKGTLPGYVLWQTPRVLTAAATDLFDLFNATGSGKLIRIRSLFCIRQVTAALATVPSWEFQAIRTSAVGTGGTAYTADGAAAPTTGLVNISKMDSTQAAIPAQITARSLPTGGATADDFLYSMYFQALQSATAIAPQMEMVAYLNAMPELPFDNPWLLREGQGFKVRQITATVSTGVAFGWIMAFTLV